MWAMFIFLISLITSSFNIQAMDVPQGTILVKDRNDHIAAVIDYTTFEDMQKLSKALQDSNHPIIFKKDLKGYSVFLQLTTEQILFLLALSEKPLKTLPLITSADIKALQLTVIILETAGNNLISIDKRAIPFFKTIEDFQEEFDNQLIISIPHVKKSEMEFLYHVINDITRTVSSYRHWLDDVEVIKRKMPPVNPEYLYNILSAANWLQADLRILAALHDVYTEKVPQNIWEKEAEKARLLKQIQALIDNKYPSIESLLNKGDKNFFVIQKSLGGPEISIKGNIYRLKGLSQIPSINQYKTIDIEKTRIVSIEEGDFANMQQVTILMLRKNKDLYMLKKGCFKPLENLFSFFSTQCNIEELDPDVFTLPHLHSLTINNSNLKTIKANWASQLPDLNQIYMQGDINLTTVEPGWLNGITKLDYARLSNKIHPALQKQIMDDLKSKFPRINAKFVNWVY